MELLLKNANIVTDKETYMSDIYIKDGVIVNIVGACSKVISFVFSLAWISTVPFCVTYFSRDTS